MTRQEAAGFTLVEVMLYLAVSGLVFLIGFMGISGRTESVRFTDSMRSLTSFFEAKYNDVRNGVNPVSATTTCGGSLRTEEAGKSGNCVLLGKVIWIKDDTGAVTVFNVVGDRLSAEDMSGLSFLDILEISNPTVVTNPMVVGGAVVNGANEYYSVKWGALYVRSVNGSAAGETGDMIGIFRNPNSTELSMAYINYSPTSEPDAIAAIESDIATNYSLMVRLQTCYKGVNGQKAQINFGIGHRSFGAGANTTSLIDLVFEPTQFTGACESA